MFTVHGNRLELRGNPPLGVGLRLLVHLAVPGPPISWTSQLPFLGVFPLFGELRRIWGRGMVISGTIYLQGHASGARRAPHATHHLTTEVCPRRRNPPLQHGPIEVIVTASFGPRSDVGMLGASLQWVTSNLRPGGRHRLRSPAVITREAMRRLLLAPSHPHSSLRRTPEGWSVVRRDRPTESLGGPIPEPAGNSEGSRIGLGHGGFFVEADEPNPTDTTQSQQVTTTSTRPPLAPHGRRRRRSRSSAPTRRTRRNTAS